MKQKPVYKNMGPARVQIIRQGIPIWLEPGECIVGARYKVYESMGLVEVGRDGLPKPKAPPAPAKPVMNDPEPEKAPVKVRKIEITDAVMPFDVIKTAPTPKPAPEPEPVVEEPEEEPEADVLDALSGEALKAMIVADLEEADPELAVELDADEDILVLIEDEPEEEDTHPFKCEICGKGFASQRGVKSHSRTHKE